MPDKPSLDLLRSLTDEHVLRALMDQRRMTRAEIATLTGISKPTVSDSVRRLTEIGLLRDTGERTTGRGRVGIYYGLAEDLGSALVVSIAPGEVVAQTIDVHGDIVGRGHAGLGRTAQPKQVNRALLTAAKRAQAQDPAATRLAVVSAADPVDRVYGKLLQLPDAPFLLGELSPVATLTPLVAGPITVDNDVNWAARAERSEAGAERLENFAYLYLGEGVGCAIVADGEVRRGHRGIAGEIAHLVTRGAKGRAVHFTDVFLELQLRQSDSTAVDVAALLRTVEADGAKPSRVRAALGAAICDVIVAIAALADPQLVILGGPWGSHPAVLSAITHEVARSRRGVPVRAAQVTTEPSLSAARAQAAHDLREAILSQARALA
jgi:predicted NBD/HSP70 family sugar kinase